MSTARSGLAVLRTQLAESIALVDAMTAKVQVRGAIQLIDAAPLSLAELGVWLEGLDEARRRECWVAAVIAAVMADDDDGGRLDVAGLAKCLIAVRDGGTAPPQPVVVPPDRAPKRTRVSSGLLLDLIAALEARCPNVGDAVKAADLMPDVNRRQRLLEWCRAKEGSANQWEIEKRESRRGPAASWFVRKAVQT